jgi:ParB-like chromosome segregation protein Spo0J
MSEGNKLGGGHCDPHDLIIVGLDDLPAGLNPNAVEDLADPERTKEAPNEGLITSIMAHGVVTPVVVREHKLSGTYGGKRVRVVVNGRQRVMATRLANKRLADKRDDNAIRVPYVLRDYGGADASGIVILANEHEKRNGPIARARDAQRLIARGKTREEVQSYFASRDGRPFSRGTLDNMLKLVSLPAATQAAIESGAMPLTVGYELATAPPAVVESATAAAVAGNAPRAEDVRASKGPKPQAKPRAPRSGSTKPTPSMLQTLLEKTTPTDRDVEEGEVSESDYTAYAILTWITTGDTEELAEHCPDIYRDVKKLYKPSKQGSEAL